MVARVDSKSILPSEGLGVGSIPTRVTNFKTKKTMDIEQFMKRYPEQVRMYFEITGESIIEDIKEYQEKVKEEGLIDEQFFLDFQDNLNKLSLDPDRE